LSFVFAEPKIESCQGNVNEVFNTFVINKEVYRVYLQKKLFLNEKMPDFIEGTITAINKECVIVYGTNGTSGPAEKLHIIPWTNIIGISQK
jgi:hypothetical protein